MHQKCKKRQKRVTQEKGNEMQKAVDRKNKKKVFPQMVKELTGKWSPRTDVVNNVNGKTMTEEDDIKGRWA